MTLGARERETLGLVDPRQLGNLEAWYDAEFVNGFSGGKPSDGDLLAQWNDLSGNNRHVLQATANNKPTFRAPRAAGVVNLFPNPKVATVVTGWQSNDGSAYVVTRDTTNPHRFVASATCTCTGTANNTSIASMYIGSTVGGSAYSIPVAAGQAYHVSFWVKASRTANFVAYLAAYTNAFVKIPFTGSPVSSKYNSAVSSGNAYSPLTPQTALAAGVWAKVDIVTPPVPAGGQLGLIGFSAVTPSGLAVAGDKISTTELLIEPWPSDGQYVDGDAGGDFAWAGVANASATVRLSDEANRVQFDGGLSILTQPANSLLYASNTPMTVYAATSGLVPNAILTNSRVMNVGAAVPGITWWSGVSASNWSLNINGVTPVFLSMPSAGRKNIWSGKNDLTNVYQSTNGSALVSGAQPGKPMNGVITVGGVAGALLSGNIFALLLYSEAHDEIKRHRIEQWLAARYGVPLLRP